MTRHDRLGFVILTIYLRPDLAEVSRVIQTLVPQPISVERFNAHLTAADVSRVNGLDAVPGPVMKVVVVVSAAGSAEVERAVKALNRLIAVYKVRVEAIS